jgi:hypothetical protein
MSGYEKNITRQNYETWFVDYLDGQLHPDEEILLHRFLDENPDLNAELNDLKNIDFTSAKALSYPHKNRLLKSDFEGLDLPESDFLLIKELEEGLTQKESLRLEDLMTHFSEVKKDANLYQKTRLIAPAMVYGKKNSLVRKRAVWLWPLTQAAVAAAVLLALILPRSEENQFTNSTDENPAFSEVIVNKPTIAPVKEHSITEESTEETLSQVNRIATAKAFERKATEAEKPDVAFIKQVPAEYLTTPNRDIQFTTPVDVYEIGLAMMIPTYINNQKIQEAQVIMPDEILIQDPSLFNIGTSLISKVTQKELAFRKIYDSEGKMIAVNVKSGEFELEQRLPWWLSR